MSNSARLCDCAAQLPGVTVLMCEFGPAFLPLSYFPSAIHANIIMFFLSQRATLNEAYDLIAYECVLFLVIIPALSVNDFIPNLMHHIVDSRDQFR